MTKLFIKGQQNIHQLKLALLKFFEDPDSDSVEEVRLPCNA